MGKLRIVLGDDHTLVRHGLRKILEEKGDWEIVAEAGDGRDGGGALCAKSEEGRCRRRKCY